MRPIDARCKPPPLRQCNMRDWFCASIRGRDAYGAWRSVQQDAFARRSLVTGCGCRNRGPACQAEHGGGPMAMRPDCPCRTPQHAAERKMRGGPALSYPSRCGLVVLESRHGAGACAKNASAPFAVEGSAAMPGILFWGKACRICSIASLTLALPRPSMTSPRACMQPIALTRSRKPRALAPNSHTPAARGDSCAGPRASPSRYPDPA